jgi:hypothetical protein
MKDMSKAKMWTIFSKQKPDPIVFYQVKGGYLIVTAWGDEARDEVILNPNTN